MVQAFSSPGTLEGYGPGTPTPGMPSKVAVIGAGVAGLACARELRSHRVRVRVFDKAGGPGGRATTHRTDRFQFDHGAQYFTIRDWDFGHAVADWAAAGAVAPWKGRVCVLERGEVREADDDTVRYVGVPGMSAMARRLAGDLRVAAGVHVTGVEPHAGGYRLRASDADYGTFDAIVVSVPAPQAVALLKAVPELAARVGTIEMRPTWAVLLGYEEPLELPFDGAFVHGSPVTWVARNNSKPGREGGEAWVLHGGHEWSERHLDDPPEEVLRRLRQEWARAAGRSLPEPVYETAHRWRYAVPAEPLAEPCLLSSGGRVGVCGDGCGGPRIEGAYLSGHALARNLLDVWS